MCLEYIPCSNGDKEKINEHIITVHCAECHVEKLAEMCGEAEEREEREGWSLDDIIEEERERREAAEKRRAESGGLMGMLRRLLGKTDSPDRMMKSIVSCAKKSSILIAKCTPNTLKIST